MKAGDLGPVFKSSKPDSDGGEEDKAEEVDGGLLVAGGDSSVAFDLAEEVLDEMTLLVEVGVDRALACAVRLRGDDRGHLFVLDGLDDAVGVVAFVGDEVLPLGLLDELGRFGDVVDVPWGDVDVERITEPVHESVDFGSETAARASNSLALGPPFPPAASWCALA